jgi:hypothetical protein
MPSKNPEECIWGNSAVEHGEGSDVFDVDNPSWSRLSNAQEARRIYNEARNAKAAAMLAIRLEARGAVRTASVGPGGFHSLRC